MLNEGKSILIITFITILTKLIGFIREIAMASVFGATSYTDAYLIATTIPFIVFASLGESLSTTFIPMYSYITEKKSKDAALKFMNNILNILVLITIILSIFGVLFARPLVSVFAIGFKGQTLELAVKYTKIMLPGIILIGTNYIVTAYLQANRNFYVTAFIAIPKNIVIILSIILSSFWGKTTLVYGTLFAIASQLFYQLYFALKSGYKYKTERKLFDSDIKRLVYLIIPVFLGMTVQQLNVLIDKALASTLSEGSIAALDFAHKLDLFVFGIFTAPLVMVVYTMISQLAAKDDWKEFNDTIQKSISYMLLILIPVSIGAMCLCTPVVKVLFQRGNFNERATQMTSIALFYYSIGMVGSGLRIVISKAFYSLRDTKTPMLNGFIAIIMNIVLNFILIKPLGHGGLALATSISSLVGTILLFFSLKVKMHSFDGGKVLNLIIKAGVASLVMAIGVKALYALLSQALGSEFSKEVVSLFSSILLGAFIYFISIILMKVEEASFLITYFKSKIGTLKQLIWHRRVSDESMVSSSQLKLLLGVTSSIEDEASTIVYQLISSLPKEKYYITLIATEGSTILDKVKSLKENSSSKLTIIVIPPLKKGISPLHNFKLFITLYKVIKSSKFDIIHLHSFKLASLGCIAAWLLRTPKIFYTVHGWRTEKKHVYVFFQRLIAKISTSIICVSNYDFNIGINIKLLNPNNTYLINYGMEKSVLRTKILRKQLKINKKTPIVGMLADFDDFNDTVNIIEIFNEVKDRGNKFKLIIMISSSQKHECEMYVNELGLSLYVHVLCDNRNISELINDFDIFSYFSNQRKVPISLIQAMFAQKPIITNNIGPMPELVQQGRNGYILKEHDDQTTVINIESLLKSYNLREVMGKNSKTMAYRKFSKEKMISEHELLYSTFNIYSDNTKG